MVGNTARGFSNGTTAGGPKASRKGGEIMMDRPKDFGKAALHPVFKRGADLRWQRTPEGLKTNVKWIVRQHSPDGFEIGYSGSGPADLALNAMAALYPAGQGGEVERCFDGNVSFEAWLFHHDFKFEFLVKADRMQGVIKWADIDAWLKTKTARLEGALLVEVDN